MAMNPKIRYVIGGILLALLIVRLFILFTSPVSHQLFALFLAATACVYFGAALGDTSIKWLSVESLLGIAFFAFAALGLIRSPYWLAAGFVLHGIWDMLHHPKMVKTKVVRWFPPLCAAFDFVVAAYIFTFY